MTRDEFADLVRDHVSACLDTSGTWRTQNAREDAARDAVLAAWEAQAAELERLRAEVERLSAPVEVTGITRKEDATRAALYWRDAAKRTEAKHVLLRAERDALAAEVARLQPPTREEVERAVDALLSARQRAVEANPRTVQDAFAALSSARDALVALATRGT